MVNFLNLLSFINQLFPIVLETVKTVEAAFPQSGQGSTKLAMVTNLVEQAAGLAGQSQDVIKQVTPLIEPLINSSVALYNATGVFKSAPAATPAPAPATTS
jgi:hypothetical protein